jgi:hypothetical protein
LTGYPLSRVELSKMGGVGPLYRFLEKYATRDVVRMFDDFTGDTINLDLYALANSGGAGAANFATQVLANGVVRGATGTTDNGSISLVGPIIYSGANNAGMEVRLKVDVVTGYNLEVGFIDAVPGSNASGVSDVDTPTAAFADGAVLQIDTDQTLQTLAFVTKGAAVTIQATTLTTPITVLTAATYVTVRIQTVGQKVYLWVNGTLVPHAVTVNHITAATLLAPWIYARTRDTTAKLVDLDYVDLWADRA